MVELSTFHRIALAEEYEHLVKHPQRTDYSLHTVYVKEVNGQPLKQADLVIAGVETREKIPQAEKYPVHFRKTYYPQSFFTDPAIEFEATQRAAEILHAPAPVGYSKTKFRSSFIPGRTYKKLSPFGASPYDRNINLARQCPEGQLIGLWHILEEIYRQLKRLHEHRFLHGDMQLQNIIVCPSPIRAFLVDFEVSVLDFDGPDEEWEEKCLADEEEILREAIYIQTALGQQQGELSERSVEMLSKLFPRPARFEETLKEAGLH